MHHPPKLDLDLNLNLEPVLEDMEESSSRSGSGGGGCGCRNGSGSERYFGYMPIPSPQVVRDERREEMWKRKLDESPEGRRRREKRAEERLVRLMTMSSAGAA